MNIAWITCYFNHAGWSNLLNNFNWFRNDFPFPTISAEAYWRKEPETDSEILLEADDNCVMWQKEALLNKVLHSLPADYDVIGWVDADIHLEGLHEDLIKDGLSKNSVLQLFSKIELLDHKNNRISISDGFASKLNGGRSGFGWIARREVLENGFYDGSVCGGGDVLMACAFVGRWQPGNVLSRYLAKDWLNWAWPVYKKVRGKVGCLPLTAQHRWHGSIKNRQYSERHKFFAEKGFDPAFHINKRKSGLWEWTGSAPEDLKKYMYRYFISRQEDMATGLVLPCCGEV